MYGLQEYGELMIVSIVNAIGEKLFGISTIRKIIGGHGRRIDHPEDETRLEFIMLDGRVDSVVEYVDELGSVIGVLTEDTDSKIESARLESIRVDEHLTAHDEHLTTVKLYPLPPTHEGAIQDVTAEYHKALEALCDLL